MNIVRKHPRKAFILAATVSLGGLSIASERYANKGVNTIIAERDFGKALRAPGKGNAVTLCGNPFNIPYFSGKSVVGKDKAETKACKSTASEQAWSALSGKMCGSFSNFRLPHYYSVGLKDEISMSGIADIYYRADADQYFTWNDFYAGTLIHERAHKEHWDRFDPLIHGKERIFDTLEIDCDDKRIAFLAYESEMIADMTEGIFMSTLKDRNTKHIQNTVNWRAETTEPGDAHYTIEALKVFKQWLESEAFTFPDPDQMTEKEILDFSFDVSYAFYIHKYLTEAQREERAEMLKTLGVIEDWRKVSFPQNSHSSNLLP